MFHISKKSQKRYEAKIPSDVDEPYYKHTVYDDVQPSCFPIVKIYCHESKPRAATENDVRNYCKKHKITVINSYFLRVRDEDELYYVICVRKEKDATWLGMKWAHLNV